MNQVYILKLQVEILNCLLQAEKAKEGNYSAPWLKNANTVYRVGGRFASKGQSIASDDKNIFNNIKASVESINELTNESIDAIANRFSEISNEIINNKTFLVNGKSVKENVGELLKQYKEVETQLKDPKNQKEIKKNLGKAIAIATPIAVSVAFALGPELAIPFFLGQEISIVGALTSATINLAASFAIDKGLDKLDVKDGWVRFGIKLATLGAVTSIVKQVKAVGDFIKITERLTEYELRYMSKTLTEAEAKNVSETLSKEKNTLIGNITNITKQYNELRDKLKSLEDKLLNIETEIGNVTKTKAKVFNIQNIIKQLNNERDVILHDLEQVKRLHLAKVKDLYTEVDKLRITNKKLDVFEKNIGYNPRKRFEELLTLPVSSSDPAIAANVNWRIGILKAEAKYGKILDDIADDVENAYSTLITRLTKNKRSPVIEQLSDEERNEIGIVTHYSHINANDNLGLMEKIKAEIANLQKLTNTHIKASITNISDDIAFAIGGKNSSLKEIPDYCAYLEKCKFWNRNNMGVINIPDSKEFRDMGYDPFASELQKIRHFTWHEIGHLLEQNSRKTIQMSEEFLKTRGKESGFISLVQPNGRVLVQNHFYHQYIGTLYKRMGIDYPSDSTELLSSGLEALSNPKLCKDFINFDRETLLYVLGILG